MKHTAFLFLITLSSAALAADGPEIRNGDFEKGKQFWRGSGKVVADGSNKASWRQVSKGHMPRSTVCASLARCSAMQYITLKGKDIDC